MTLRLSWRAALAVAGSGWPCAPWRDGAVLERVPSSDPAVLEGWAGRFPGSDAAVDLGCAGLVAVGVTGCVCRDPGGHRALVDGFSRFGAPPPGVLTMAAPSGGWWWVCRSPGPGAVSGGRVRGLLLVVEGFLPLPGAVGVRSSCCGWGSGAYRLEDGADLVAGVLPGWLAGG